MKHNFHVHTLKRKSTGEPLVDDDSQSILVAGRNSLASYLFRSHIGDGARRVRRSQVCQLDAHTLGHDGDAKIAEQDLLLAAQQEVFRLDITMDELLVVSILQGGGNLLHIRNENFDRHLCPTWMMLAQGSIGRVFHDQKRDSTIDTEVQHSHNIGMDEMRDSASLAAKVVDAVIDQVSSQQLDGGLSVEMNMLTEIDIGKPTLA